MGKLQMWAQTLRAGSWEPQCFPRVDSSIADGEEAPKRRRNSNQHSGLWAAALLSRQGERSDGCSWHSSPWRSSRLGGFIYFAFVSRHRRGPSCRHITTSQGAPEALAGALAFPRQFSCLQVNKNKVVWDGGFIFSQPHHCQNA